MNNSEYDLDDVTLLQKNQNDINLFRHFITTDAKKFHDIWVMNEEEAKDLSKKVLEEDKAIFEQQLGLPWQSPEL